MIGVGHIGLGGMGSEHLRNFSDVHGCRVIAGADLHTAVRKRFALQFPKANVYSDYKDLLDDAKVDAVVVAVPTAYHEHVAVDVMRSGRPVLCEKPMARTIPACRRMIEVSRKTRKMLMVGHVRRYDGHWGHFAKLVRQGVLGKPVLWRSVTAGSEPPGGWFLDHQLSGGPLMDGAVHNYDFANMIFGDPIEVTARSIKLRRSRTAIDTATAVVQYPRNNQIMLSWSWANQAGTLNDVIGPKGSLTFGPGQFQSKARAKTKTYYCHTSSTGKSKLIQVNCSGSQMFFNEAKHFIAAVNGKVKCKTPGTEAIKAVAVAEAILKIAPKGGTRKITW